MAINKISGNILADNLVRGSALAFQTDLLYLDVVSGNVGINTASATHTLTVNGNCNILGPFQANDVSSSNSISATGNVDAGNLNAAGLSLSGNVISPLNVTGNIAGGNVLTPGLISAAGNVNSANLNLSGGAFVGGVVSAVGNVRGGNITTTGLVTATGNVTGGNLTTTGAVTATGNVAAGNLVTGGVVSATGNVTGGNITTSGDVSATGNVFAANFSSTGNVSLSNLTVSNTTISTGLATGNITLTPTGTATVIIDTTTGLVLPVGNTAQRPSPAVTGTLRFNTGIQRLEVYDGSQWDSVVSDVTNQTLQGDGSTVVFTLNRDSTTAATLVAINGIVQLPTTAYSVAGNTITFTQAPIFTDTIDIRFL